MRLLLLPILFVMPTTAVAQAPDPRMRAVADASACLDRCDAGFAQCMGTPDRNPGGPLTPIPAPERRGTVPTGQPFEECLLDRDVCLADCNLALARTRRDQVRRR
jgi:hypothetical protein